jgi:hypothetical protein
MGVGEEGQPWFWSILEVAPSGFRMNGLAHTLEDAKRQFQTSWNEWRGWRAGKGATVSK